MNHDFSSIYLYPMFIVRVIPPHPNIHLDLAQTSFEKIYRSEQDVKTKERMLLVLYGAYPGMVSAQITRGLDRCKDWASAWLKRCRKEVLKG